MKKAQGLPMNVIIIAALALLVLVIVAVIFAGWSKIFSEGTRECKNQGGKCFYDPCGVGEAEDYSTEYSAAKCGEDQYCCLQAGVT